MAILFNITLPCDFLSEIEDDDARWLKTKEIVEGLKKQIEDETGAEVDIEW